MSTSYVALSCSEKKKKRECNIITGLHAYSHDRVFRDGVADVSRISNADTDRQKRKRVTKKKRERKKKVQESNVKRSISSTSRCRELCMPDDSTARVFFLLLFSLTINAQTPLCVCMYVCMYVCVFVFVFPWRAFQTYELHSNHHCCLHSLSTVCTFPLKTLTPFCSYPCLRLCTKFVCQR